uniref:Uncharacterized protein n=1 Tax=Plectus sambesii TaxID=2011161 RepID=A0A914X221_9BILA
MAKPGPVHRDSLRPSCSSGHPQCPLQSTRINSFDFRRGDDQRPPIALERGDGTAAVAAEKTRQSNDRATGPGSCLDIHSPYCSILHYFISLPSTAVRSRPPRNPTQLQSLSPFPRRRSLTRRSVTEWRCARVKPQMFASPHRRQQRSTLSRRPATSLRPASLREQSQYKQLDRRNAIVGRFCPSRGGSIFFFIYLPTARRLSGPTADTPANASPAATHSAAGNYSDSSGGGGGGGSQQQPREGPNRRTMTVWRAKSDAEVERDGRRTAGGAKAPAPRLATGAPMRADKAVRQPERPLERRSDVVGDWSGPAGGGRHLSSFIGASRCAATEGAPRRPWPVGGRERSRVASTNARLRERCRRRPVTPRFRRSSTPSPSPSSSHSSHTMLALTHSGWSVGPTGRLAHGRTKARPLIALAGPCDCSRVARCANKQHSDHGQRAHASYHARRASSDRPQCAARLPAGAHDGRRRRRRSSKRTAVKRPTMQRQTWVLALVGGRLRGGECPALANGGPVCCDAAGGPISKMTLGKVAMRRADGRTSEIGGRGSSLDPNRRRLDSRGRVRDSEDAPVSR